MKKNGPTLDPLVIIPVLYLLSIGLVVLDAIVTTTRISIDFSITTQLVATIIGLGLLVVVSRNGSIWYGLGLPLYLVSCTLLLLVLLYGENIFGATRWLQLGSFQMQPSELMKIALIIVQARLLSSRIQSLDRPWPLVLSALYVSGAVLLVFLQPDLGTVLVLIGIWFIQLLFSEVPKRTIVLLLGIFLLALPLAYPFLADYQKQRIETFFNPSLDTQGSGYNVLQATIALGSGGLLGKGLDAGSQSQLNFLPSQHTDFVFAVIGEKLGFIGGVSVIIAFTVLLLRLSVLVLRSQSSFVRLSGIGVVAVLGFQFLINTAMNVGLLPVTGIPLPFISGGGTHILSECLMIGIVLGLLRQSKGHFTDMR